MDRKVLAVISVSPMWWLVRTINPEVLPGHKVRRLIIVIDQPRTRMAQMEGRIFPEEEQTELGVFVIVLTSP